MSDALHLVTIDHDLSHLMMEIGKKARMSSRALALASPTQKNQALQAMAQALRDHQQTILAANREDVNDAKMKGQTGAFLDRLMLDHKRLEGIAVALEGIAALPDPVGRSLARFERPNGLIIERVATPLGVIGVIFESRPNVTVDAGALCLKAGNAAILRAGSESFRTSAELVAAMGAGLALAGLPKDAIQLVPSRDREAVSLMLGGLNGTVDVIVPRGGKSLVARVQADARVPVFAHLDGNCHVYIHADADLDMAQKIVLNAKMRRTGVCGAAETLLVDQASPHMRPLVLALLEAGCAVRGDAVTQALDSRVTQAVEDDWRTEYLDSIIAVKVVTGLDEAIFHIETYGSHHTDAIITNSLQAAERFLSEVDSAIVLHNASTQFADGGEFGFGAEIGIATGRMHARGPVGVEQLTSFKYKVLGHGQVRAG